MMNDKKTVLFVSIALTIITIAIVTTINPLDQYVNKHASIESKAFIIEVIDGQITDYRIIITVSNGIITNGTMKYITLNDGIATVTLIQYNNNSKTTITFTKENATDALITYSMGTLTYDGVSYYSQRKQPFTFEYTKSEALTDVIIVEIHKATVSWKSTTIR